MLDLRFVVENLDRVRDALAARNVSFDLEPIASLAGRRRTLIARYEGLRCEQNRASDEMKTLARGSPEFLARVSALKEVSREARQVEAELREVEESLRQILLLLPNLPADDVPFGTSDADNVEVRRVGEPLLPIPDPRPHWEIGEALGILDFERAAKIAGARFAVLHGSAARLERALINFMLDLHTQEHGYRETLPPFLVNRDSMTGTGQLPKFEEEAFRTDDLFLVPTAEVPVTNLHRDEVLEGADLPLRYVAYTPCFRREAGSYGKDTRGLIRQHQFNKVELVVFCRPEESQQRHEELTCHAEEVLRRLGLPYRVVSLCTADLGFAAAKCYDLEVWLPGQRCFREISSCSNFGDFQARRANIRYRPGPKERPRLVHTLNGSGLAVGRTLVAILENYQRGDGSVEVPEVLRPYMGGATNLIPMK